MAAETVTPAIIPTLQMIAHQRASQASDNWKRAGESGAPTTSTATFVITWGASPDLTTVTCNWVTA